LDNSATSAKAAKAPANAPRDSDRLPAPIPRTITQTAPVDTPKTNGSASALRNSAWRIAPQIASPAPASAATRARLSRRFQTTLCSIGAISAPVRPSSLVTERMTVSRPML